MKILSNDFIYVPDKYPWSQMAAQEEKIRLERQAKQEWESTHIMVALMPVGGILHEFPLESLNEKSREDPTTQIVWRKRTAEEMS